MENDNKMIEKANPNESSKDNEPNYFPRWLVGIFVIVIGVVFLLKAHGYHDWLPFRDNWWALFILIPAVMMYLSVYERYKRLGRFDAEAGGRLTGALAITVVAVIFLAGLSWHKWWPLFIIVGGLSIIFNKGWGKD